MTLVSSICSSKYVDLHAGDDNLNSDRTPLNPMVHVSTHCGHVNTLVLRRASCPGLSIFALILTNCFWEKMKFLLFRQTFVKLHYFVEPWTSEIVRPRGPHQCTSRRCALNPQNRSASTTLYSHRVLSQRNDSPVWGQGRLRPSFLVLRVMASNRDSDS